MLVVETLLAKYTRVDGIAARRGTSLKILAASPLGKRILILEIETEQRVSPGIGAVGSLNPDKEKL
jgi:hypothetical protein